MKLEQYNTMNKIIADLDPEDIEQLEDYAVDCDIVGAVQAAQYIRNQIKFKNDVRLDLMRAKLSGDFSGC